MDFGDGNFLVPGFPWLRWGVEADDIAAMNVADLRMDYVAGMLDRQDLADDPIQQFRIWFSEATADPRIIEANAMTLATADPDEGVTSRIVLLKGVGPDGFRFFTNYESGKGRQIASDARVALSFYWQGVERQVHITGLAEKLPREVSESYFQSRPRQSRLGAWASQQSRIVESREALESAYERVSNKYPGDEIPMPPFWGGYLVRPQAVEFWQGRPGRLHDRFRFTLSGDFGWKVDRLEP